jgi:hypothetical protein
LKRLAAFVTLTLACHSLAGGEPDAGVRSRQEALVSPQVVTIQASANVRVGPELEVGAGNLWPEADGALGAGLWILAKKVSPERKHLRVRKGQEFSESGYAFKVLEIAKGPEGAFVRVEVRPAAP